jgi:hypothetical protein
VLGTWSSHPFFQKGTKALPNWCVDRHGRSCKSIAEALDCLSPLQKNDKSTIKFWIDFSCLHSKEHVGCTTASPSQTELFHAGCIGCDEVSEPKKKIKRKLQKNNAAWVAVKRIAVEDGAAKANYAKTNEIYNSMMAEAESAGIKLNYNHAWESARQKVVDEECSQSRSGKKEKQEQDAGDMGGGSSSSSTTLTA